MKLFVSAKFCPLFLLILLPFFISAQGTGSISGTVADSEGTLPGASVEIESSNSGTATDVNGYFIIEGLDEGKHVIVINFLGHKIYKQPVVIKAGETANIDVTLEESQLGLDEIVITGTLEPTYISESPVKIEVITDKHIETYMPSASTSLVESISLVNGVQEVVACGVCYTNSISVNGLPGPYTAILMDGTPIYGNLASVYGLNGIPSMIIDRFEVVKGPSSTLYGSEAVAGVINIITKNPEYQPLMSVDLMGTTHLESFGNLAFAPKIGKSSGYIGLNYAYMNDFEDANNDLFSDNVALDRVSLFTKWNIHRKSDKKFTLAGKYYYEDRRNGVESFLADRRYQDIRGNDSIYGESIFTKRAELFGTYEFNTREKLALDFSFSHHFQDSYYGADFYLAKQNIAFANLTWKRMVKSHYLTAGLTNRFQNYDDNTISTADSVNGILINQPDNQYIPGVFVQDEFKVHPRVTLLAGARLDYYSAHGPIFSPRFNLKYSIGEWSTLRANFGTGFRIVNLFTEDHAFVSGQRTVEILEDLKPERSYNSSVSFNHVYNVGLSSGMFDADVYFTYFTNKIIPDYDQPGKIVYENTSGHAITTGASITMTHEFSIPLAFSVGFNAQRVTETELDDDGNETTRDVEFAPKWSGMLNANYSWKRADMTFAYTLRFTGPMALPEVFDLDENGLPLGNSRPTVSKPFALQNIQLTKNFRKINFSVYAGIQNLFDYRQEASPLIGFDDPNSAPGFSDFFDTSYAFSPFHGREFYLGVKWNLMKKDLR